MYNYAYGYSLGIGRIGMGLEGSRRPIDSRVEMVAIRVGEN